MGIGKYYCDYCDKEFQDTANARKRHLSGVYHQRARAQWYASLNDPYGGGPLIKPDGSVAKGVCTHFLRTGTCKFGNSCIYFHPVQNVVGPSQITPGPNFVAPGNPGGNHFASGSYLSGNQPGVSWGNLPLSLRPPPEGGYPPLPFVDWC